MKLEIPKIFKKLQFSEYAPEFGDVSLNIWVNVPSAMLYKWITNNKELMDLVEKSDQSDEQKDESLKFTQTDDLRLKQLIEEQVSFYASVLFDNGAPVPVDEIRGLFVEAKDTDPALQNWLVRQIIDPMIEHRNARKN